MKEHIFREYDIRGRYPEDFNENFCYNLGRAYISYLSGKTKQKNLSVSIGHDARLSSPEIVSALSRGMQASGAKVILLGLITTPISYFSTFKLDIDGAIMVTGSHNPPDFNGFKISVGKTTISGKEIQDLKEIMKSKKFIDGSLNGLVEESKYDIFPTYIERYKEEFKDLSGIKVVLDCGNGVAGVIVRELYEAVGLKPKILFEEPDGKFPNHHPDPTVEENLTELKKVVLAEKADLGIGFDGDADRIGIVTNDGRFLLGDEIIYLFAQSILKENPGATIVADVKCSDRLYTLIEEMGGKAVMWKTGHSLIKQKVKDEQAPFGGELSCHIFFRDRNYGFDDSLYAGLRLIEILRNTKKSVEDLLVDYPKAYTTPEIRIDTNEEKKLKIVESVKNHYKSKPGVKVLDLDGVRASFEDGWALVRSSNTQAVISMRFEASSQKRLEEIESEAMSIIKPLL